MSHVTCPRSYSSTGGPYCRLTCHITLPTLLPAHHASDLRAMLNFNQPNDRCLHGTPPTIVPVFSSSYQELAPFFHLLCSCVSRLGSALVHGERLRVGICYHTYRSLERAGRGRGQPRAKASAPGCPPLLHIQDEHPDLPRIVSFATLYLRSYFMPLLHVLGAIYAERGSQYAYDGPHAARDVPLTVPCI